MNKKNIEYHVKVNTINGWRFRELYLDNVYPYYDLYENGDIDVYIRSETEYTFFGFCFYRCIEIIKVKDNNIVITETEIPKRMNCNAK